MNVEEHLGLAGVAARRWSKSTGLPFEDLFQEAVMGLMRAAQDFDPTRGKFSTYAFWWVNAEIRRYLSRRSAAIHIPEKARGKIVKAGKLQEYIPLSLDAPRVMREPSAESRREERSLHEHVADGAPSPEEVAAEKEERRILWREVAKLTPRTRSILRWRFEEGLTLEECGERLGLTRERVRQIEKEALEILRPRLVAALSKDAA